MNSLNNTNTQQKNESTKLMPFVFLFLALVFFDQAAKHFAHNIFRNAVFAFSIPLPVWLIYFVYAGVVLAMVYYTATQYNFFSFTSKIAWTFIFAGAVSNIIERIFLGYVRDFIYIHFLQLTGIYNLADFFIIIGIVILLIPYRIDKN